MVADAEDLAVGVGGAAAAEGAAGASWTEGGGALRGDGHGDSVRTGDGAVDVVDGELVASELIVAESLVAGEWSGFDDRPVSGGLERCSGRSR